jgi:hypothetical protein
MSDEPLFVVVGNLDWLDHADRRHFVSGRDLFDDLAERKLWYTSRPMTVESGTTAIFYLKGEGVIGYATVEKSSPVDASDKSLLQRLGIEYFQTRFNLKNVQRIDPLIELKPLVPRLTFIKNKGSHWGTSLQSSPRRIPKRDFDLILSNRRST